MRWKHYFHSISIFMFMDGGIYSPFLAVSLHESLWRQNCDATIASQYHDTFFEFYCNLFNEFTDKWTILNAVILHHRPPGENDYPVNWSDAAQCENIKFIMHEEELWRGHRTFRDWHRIGSSSFKFCHRSLRISRQFAIISSISISLFLNV